MDEKAKFLTKQTFCCDPFTIHKKLVKKGLRTITKDLVDKFDNPEIKYGQKICSNCRIKVYKYTNLSDKSSESASTASEEQGERSLEDDDFIDQESELSLLNESIAVIGELPFKKQKLNRNVAYIPHKTKKIEEALVKKIQIVSPESKHGAKRVRVRKDDTILLEDIKGFVTAVYDNKWWLACVLQTYPENMQVKLTFLEPEGPSTSFKYPLKSDILTIFYKNILSIVEPITVTGRTYSLKEAEIENANQMLKKHSNA